MNKKDQGTSRRDFLKLGVGAAVGATLGTLPLQTLGAGGTLPNVIFISIDDLNDFPQPFGGYSAAITPNIARLASAGITFQRAYCTAPYCGASRSSALSGISPFRSGLTYQENIIEKEASVVAKLGLPKLMTIPRFFKEKGYRVMGGGKIYHAGYGDGAAGASYYDAQTWNEYFFTDFKQIARDFPGVVKDYRFGRTTGDPEFNTKNDRSLDKLIGADYNLPEQEADMPDKLLTQWAAQKIREASANPSQPFFLGVGLFRPHISFQVPQRFYNLYPLSSVQVPPFSEQLQDIEDLPPFALKYLVNMNWSAYGQTMRNGSPSSDHYILQNMSITQETAWRTGHAQAIQGYLASMSFSDECVGQILAELDRNPTLKSNTIVVLWSDHGWFLGEKLAWQKYKLWERATRVPLIISRPGRPTGNCYRVVSSLDLFPTIADMVVPGSHIDINKNNNNQLEGTSLVPLLDNPSAAWIERAVTTQIVPESEPDPTKKAVAFHSLRTDNWRYIAYPPIPGATLSEELYDLSVDSKEKQNLLYWKPGSYAQVRDNMRRALRNLSGDTSL